MTAPAPSPHQKMYDIISGPPKVTLTLEIPRQRILADSFARAAQISPDNRTLTVGSFTARRLGAMTRAILALDQRFANHHWEVESTNPDIRAARAFVNTAPDDISGMIDKLAMAEAALHLTQADIDDALRARFAQPAP